jgi:RimJ/RimL family protein N-acetyltransferase
MTIPTLRTARLRLRPLREDDLDAYATMCADPEVMRFIGAGGPIDRAQAWRQMAMFVGAWSLQGVGMWAVQRAEDGRLIGRVGYLNPPDWPHVELGWLLGREAWGLGYAQEAARAALAWGRDAAGIDRPISMVRPQNLRSIALAQRLGARLEAERELMGAAVLVFRHGR